MPLITVLGKGGGGGGGEVVGRCFSIRQAGRHVDGTDTRSEREREKEKNERQGSAIYSQR